MHETKSVDSSILKVIPTGTELVVLKRDKELAHVREPGGTVGWIDAGYLMTEQPASLVVEALDRHNKELADDLRIARAGLDTEGATSDERMTKENVALREQLSSERLRGADLQAKLSQLQSSTGDMTSGAYVKRLEADNAELKTKMMRKGGDAEGGFDFFGANGDAEKSNVLWTLIFLVVAFLGGVLFMDYLNRRRHGGFRI